MPVGKSLDSAHLGRLDRSKAAQDNAGDIMRGRGNSTINIHTPRKSTRALPLRATARGEGPQPLPGNVVSIVRARSGKFLGSSFEVRIGRRLETGTEDPPAASDKCPHSRAHGLLSGRTIEEGGHVRCASKLTVVCGARDASKGLVRGPQVHAKGRGDRSVGPARKGRLLLGPAPLPDGPPVADKPPRQVVDVLLAGPPHRGPEGLSCGTANRTGNGALVLVNRGSAPCKPHHGEQQGRQQALASGRY